MWKKNCKIPNIPNRKRAPVPVQVKLYRYTLCKNGQCATCTGTGQGCTGTGSSSSPVLTCFRVVKSRIRIPMSRDLKKRLMGVQLRLELGEKKCTVPRRLGEVSSSWGRLSVLTQDFQQKLNCNSLKLLKIVYPLRVA